MSTVMINLWYVVAAALFIFGLKQLGSPATAVRGNVLSSLAMVIAIAVTLLNKEILTFELILVAAVIGAVIGAITAQKVEMIEERRGVICGDGLFLHQAQDDV